MIYEWSISIPAGTTKANWQKKEVVLPKGVIHKVDVVFPPGCAGCAHLIVKKSTHQIYPTNGDDDFNGDGEVISFKDHYRLPYKNNFLQIYTWNTGSYDHTVTLRLGVLPEPILIPYKPFESVLASMKRLFGLR